MADIRIYQTSDPILYRTMLAGSSIGFKVYCERFGYNYEADYSVGRGCAPWHATFNRIPYLKKLMDEGFDGWCAYVDADTYLADHSFDLSSFLDEKKDYLIVAHGRSAWQISAGLVFINYSHFRAKEFVQELSKIYEHCIDQATLAASPEPWGQVWAKWFNDQNIFQDVLRFDYRFNPHVFLDTSSRLRLRDATFIATMIREEGSLQERTTSLLKRNYSTISETNDSDVKFRALARLHLLLRTWAPSCQDMIAEEADRAGVAIRFQSNHTLLLESFVDPIAQAIWTGKYPQDNMHIREWVEKSGFVGDVLVSDFDVKTANQLALCLYPVRAEPRLIGAVSSTAHAISLAQRQKSISPHSAAGAYKLAQLQYSAGQLDSAVESAKEACALFPHTDSFALMAAYLGKQKRFEEVEISASIAIGLDRKNGHAYNALAHAQLSLQRRSDAIKTLQTALRFVPNPAYLASNLSELYEQEENYHAALEAIDTAISIKSDKGYLDRRQRILEKMENYIGQYTRKSNNASQ